MALKLAIWDNEKTDKTNPLGSVTIDLATISAYKVNL